MAECPGGRGARSQFRFGAGGFLKGLYPFRADIMDTGQVSQTTAGLSASDLVSPSKGTRTRTVREYEQTINELKKENFDLKLRVYLFEEAMNKNRGKDCCSPDKDKAVQVMVQLKLETESLRNELGDKDKLLQEAVDQSEKCAADMRDWIRKCAQLQALLSELPSKDEYVLLLHEKEDLLKQIEALQKSLAEKAEGVDEANQKIDFLSERNRVLEEKLHKRSLAIQGFVYKNYQEKEILPDKLRNVAVSAVQAAKSQNREALAMAVRSIQVTLNQILSSSLPVESDDKENQRSSQAKCLNEDNVEKSRLILPCQSVTNTDVGRIEHLKDVLSARNSQPSDLESFAHNSCVKGKMLVESSTNFVEKDVVDFVNFFSIPPVITEDTHISGRNTSGTQQGCLGDSSVINIENIFSPTVSPALSYQHKDTSTSVSSYQHKDASTSVSSYQHKDASTSVSYQNRDDSISVLSRQCTDVLTSDSPSQNKDASISVSSYLYKGTPTPVSPCQNNDASTPYKSKDASTSVSCQKEDVSSSVSLYDNKDSSVSSSTSLSPQIQELIAENDQLRQKLEEKHATIENLIAPKEMKSCRVQTEKIEAGSSKASLHSNTCTQTDISGPILYEVVESQKSAQLSDSVDVFRENSQTVSNEDYMNERNELHERLAFSSSINVELMKHLHNLEQFMEDLLKHRLDGSLENASEQSDFLASLSRCLNESLKLSNVLSDHLSICEGSKLFEECKSMLYRSTSFSDSKSIPQLELSLPELTLASDERNHQPPRMVTHKHLSYPSSDSDIWSEPDRNVSMQRIGINLQYFHTPTKSPRKFKSKERRMMGRMTTDHNTSSSEMQPGFKCFRQNGSVCRRLFDRDTLRNEDFPMEKYSIILAEKFSNLKSILNTLENIKDGNICEETWSQMNSVVTSLGEALQKFEIAKEHTKSSSPSICGKCALLELLTILKMSSGDFNIQEATVSSKSEILRQFLTKMGEVEEVCKEPFPLFSAEVCKMSKSTQSGPFSGTEQEKINDLEKVVVDLNCKNEKLTKKFDKLQNLLSHERNMFEPIKSENLVLSNDVNHLKEEVMELNDKNEKLEKDFNEVQNLLSEERSLLESVKPENLLLSNEVIHLKEEILDLQEKENILSLQNADLNEKLASLGKDNSELNEILNVLEQKREESDIALNQLSAELQKNKSELVNMSIKCIELEKELSGETKMKEEFAENFINLQSSSSIEKEKYRNEIENLNVERKNFIAKLESAQSKILSLENERSLLNDNLNDRDNKLTSLLKTIEELQGDKEALSVTCTELQSSLENAKEQCVNLQQEISKKLAACQAYYRELQQVEAKLLSEKTELVDKIAQLTSEKDAILQKLNSEKERSEKIMAEKIELDQKLVESCHSQRLSNIEKQKLVDDISFLTSERGDILQKFNCEKEHSEKLIAEKMELNEALLKSHQQITSLRLSNEQLEKTRFSLLQKNEQIQSVLVSSDSNCAVLGNDLKHIRETVLNLESRCAAYEKELVASAGMKDYVVECLLSIKNELITARQKMAEMCKAYNAEDSLVRDETPVSDFIPLIDGNNVITLCDIVSSESKKLLQILDVLLGVLERSQLKSHEMHSIEERHCKKMSSIRKQTEMQNHELEHLKSQNNHLQNIIEENQKSMSEKEKCVKFSSSEIQSMKEKLQISENEVEKRKLLLKMKEDEITMLQERVFNLQTYVNNMLVEKKDVYRKSSQEVIEKSIQTDSALTNNSFSPQAIVNPTIDKGCQDCVEGLDASVKEHSISAESLSSLKASCCERYQNKSRSLQKKLSLSQKRIEILEDEKKNLREFQASHLNSLETRESADMKMLDLESKLEQKKAFIAELKAELMKVCNSLIDKERELDDLKVKLLESETKLESTSPAIPEYHSVAEPKAVDANIRNLKNYKWKLIQTIFDIQKTFYERRGIHLNYFNKFQDHVNSLYSLQLVHPLSKSESLPVLGFHSTTMQGHGNHRVKDLMGLELDIECLENLKIFLNRFFVPSVLQVDCSPKASDLMQPVVQTASLASQDVKETSSTTQVGNTERPPKSYDFRSHIVTSDCTRTPPNFTSCIDPTRSALQASDSVPTKLLPEAKTGNLAPSQCEKAKSLEFFHSSSFKRRSEDVFEKYSSSENFALTVSRYLDFIENFFKATKEYKKWNHLDDSATDVEEKAEAKSLLLKILKEIKSLYKRAEVLFRLNTVLKSLDLSKTPDVSDRESVLSEETITISRSDTPLSTGDLSPIHMPMNLEEESIAQPSKGRRVVAEPKVPSSFESVHHRSQYSSPDLGIESDPNHESSVPEQKENKTNGKYPKMESWKSSTKQQPKISLTSPETAGKWKGTLFAGDSLYSVGHLPHYELLKREIQESLVGIKSVLSRTGDGLRHIANYTSPRKTLEYSTMRAIKDSCANIEVCLKEAYKLVGKFWIAPYPSEEEWNHLVEENQKLSDQLSKLRVLMQNQESEFKTAMEKLQHAELLKVNMEKKISKKLVKTKKVIRQAELKLLEKGCQNCPPLPKHPTEKET